MGCCRDMVSITLRGDKLLKSWLEKDISPTQLFQTAQRSLAVLLAALEHLLLAIWPKSMISSPDVLMIDFVSVPHALLDDVFFVALDHVQNIFRFQGS